MGASHSVMGGPPETSIFLSFPSAKNPRKRLSGDQKGDVAPSVPASDSASSGSSERAHRSDLPSVFVATKARRWPSGETAREPVKLPWNRELLSDSTSPVGKQKSGLLAPFPVDARNTRKRSNLL